MNVRISRTVLGWFEGSQAWFDPAEGETFELFKRFRDTGRRKDGSIGLELDHDETALLEEWASYMEVAARDGAGHDDGALGELNAARALQRQIARERVW